MGIHPVSSKVLLGLSPCCGALDAPWAKPGSGWRFHLSGGYLPDRRQDAVQRSGVVDMRMLRSGWSPAFKGRGRKPPINIM